MTELASNTWLPQNNENTPNVRHRGWVGWADLSP